MIETTNQPPLDWSFFSNMLGSKLLQPRVPRAGFAPSRPRAVSLGFITLRYLSIALASADVSSGYSSTFLNFGMNKIYYNMLNIVKL